MSPTTMKRLIQQGRLIPIINYDGHGHQWLVGWHRKPGSRKREQQIWLKPKDHVLIKANPDKPKRTINFQNGSVIRIVDPGYRDARGAGFPNVTPNS